MVSAPVRYCYIPLTLTHTSNHSPYLVNLSEFIKKPWRCQYRVGTDAVTSGPSCYPCLPACPYAQGQFCNHCTVHGASYGIDHSSCSMATYSLCCFNSIIMSPCTTIMLGSLCHVLITLYNWWSVIIVIAACSSSLILYVVFDDPSTAVGKYHSLYQSGLSCPAKLNIFLNYSSQLKKQQKKYPYLYPCVILMWYKSYSRHLLSNPFP